MLKFLYKHGKTLAIILTTAVALALLIASVFMLVKYRSELTEKSSAQAQYYTLTARNLVENNLNTYSTKAVAVANTISDYTTEEDIQNYLKNLVNREGYTNVKFARYYTGNLLKNEYGEIYLGEDVSRTYRENHPKNDTYGYAGTYDDSTVVTSGVMSVICFYSPVKNSEICNGVCIYYTRSEVENFFKSEYKNKDAEFTTMCTNTGKIIVGMEQQKVSSADIYEVIRNLCGDKTPEDRVRKLIESGTDGTVFAKIGGEEYIFSVGANKSTMQDLSIVELFRVDVLYSSSLELVHTIIAIIIIFALIVFAVVFYLIMNSIQMNRKMFNLETMDKHLDCYNRHGFEKQVKRILDRNSGSYFAVIVIQLRHYKYIFDNCGESEANNLLNYLRLTFSKIVTLEETFGHIEDGQFLLLLHAKDKKGLLERLKVHSFLATKYKGAQKLDILLKYGIYEVKDAEKISVSQMIDYANEANNTITKVSETNAGMQFNFYNDELRKIRLINEDMELRMESALQNGEFQVFYQPKYNLKEKRQDGSEALVRWYDSKTGEYNRPALFMQLFETNGFIVKLDKYVYTKVCEYISYSIAHGRRVFPVSVNVSRITAIQPDFVDYYIRVKKKFNIPDGQIMIEFTESFAYENYETLKKIIDELHAKGFKCSIDDFGCGYSSYKILKVLPMDEIKLDRFFIEKGLSHERDNFISESIITLAKELGMKVTQEGVEYKEDVDNLINLGCDVIQGYYYSHPLPLTDFLQFVATTKEHNIT